MDKSVVFDKVSKKYGSKFALKDASFELPESGVVGLLGPNGAGKTTTMKLLVGLLSSTSGQVKIFGKDPIKNKIKTNHIVGFLSETNAMYKNMRVREYLDFVASLRRANNTDLASEQVGIVNVLNRPIESLSRGYCQRVGLAAALLGDPKILVLDEPTAGLDPVEQEKIRLLIKSMSQSKLVLISSHILSEIEEVAQQLIIINEGNIVFNGPRPKGKGEVEKLFMKKIVV